MRQDLSTRRRGRLEVSRYFERKKFESVCGLIQTITRTAKSKMIRVLERFAVRTRGEALLQNLSFFLKTFRLTHVEQTADGRNSAICWLPTGT